MSWDQFYIDYGRAVFTAQSLERNLAVVVCFHEARKRGILKRPTVVEIDLLIKEMDRNPLGALIDRLQEFQCLDPTEELLFRLANANRQTLVHHYIVNYEELIETNDVESARAEIRELAKPIIDANRVSAQIASNEIERMQIEIQSRRRL